MIYILKNKIITAILLAIVVTGCGYKEINTQSRDTAFLKFTKSMFKTYTVKVNEKITFQLDACTKQSNTDNCYDDTINKLYEINSGNIVVKVFDKKKLILNKEIYLGSSNTVEINLP